MLCNIESNRLARLSYILASNARTENEPDIDTLNISMEDRELLHQMQRSGISFKKLLSQFTILGSNFNWWA